MVFRLRFFFAFSLLIAISGCGSESPDGDRGGAGNAGAGGSSIGVSGHAGSGNPDGATPGGGGSTTDGGMGRIDDGGATRADAAARPDAAGGALRDAATRPETGTDARADAARVATGDGAGDGGTGLPPGNATHLKDAAAATGRLIGTALNTTHFNEAAYASTAGAEFNFATPENEMKWDATEPAQGRFNFGGGDSVVNFAMQRGIKVKGHTLVWNQQLPAWVSSLSSASAVQSAMTNHITQVMAHFKGSVIAWDVVNEAWNNDGGSLRADVFEQFLGAAYIDEAFQTARAVDPNALLFYNDFGIEGNSAKANAAFTMIQSMKMRGIPIDGVGMQMHVSSADNGPSTAQFAANMRRYAALGLKIVVSEFDVQICTSTQAAQETRYHDIIAACVAEPACAAVTVWGITDKFSWLNGQACASAMGLLFDGNYGKKPAYTGALDALNAR